jgi:hypothetical protein
MSASGKNGRYLSGSSFAIEEIPPDSGSVRLLNLSTSGLDPGNYTAELFVSLDNRQIAAHTLQFAIYPYGTLSRSGKLTNLSVEGSAEVGGTLKITAEFLNTGSVSSKAISVSEVYLGSQLIGVAKGGEKLSRAAEQIQLVSYIRPEEPGSYKILSRIEFDGEETSSKEISFEVKDIPATQNMGMMLTLSIASIGTAIYFRKEVKKMVGKIAKKKVYYCIDCNRKIAHKGRCLMCNKTAKKRKEAQDRKYE